MKALTRNKSALWIRLGSVLVAGAALFYVFRHVNLAQLGEALHHSHPGWLLATIAFYGAAFPTAAWRWHLMLRLSGSAVHFRATMIMTLIGHFFYTLFFGVAGGDVAKSALYARWYRLSLPDILAAAPLDRLLGLGGLILFLLAAFGLAAWKGAFVHLQTSSIHLPIVWILALLVILLVAGIALKRWVNSSGMTRWLQALAQGGRQIIASPSIAWQGLLCGFLVQVTLAGSLALGLQAVSHSPVPWGQLLWTFPVISIISAVPFTVAGLGFREGAALALLGLYGISAADAVAASLLTLVARLFWAAWGGLLLWREQQFQSLPSPLPRTISAVIPSLNGTRPLDETIQHLQQIPEVCEIIVVDAENQATTRTTAAQSGCRVITQSGERGELLQLGGIQATGDVILLVQAGTWLPANAGKAILNSLRDTHVVAGGFRKRFQATYPLSAGARLQNAFRCLILRRPFGNQGIFFRREFLNEFGSSPQGACKEEFGLHRQVRKKGRLVVADAVAISSLRPG
jgi:uncharacterized membrane protein YbhN (UPF0104 family)